MQRSNSAIFDEIEEFDVAPPLDNAPNTDNSSGMLPPSQDISSSAPSNDPQQHRIGLAGPSTSRSASPSIPSFPPLPLITIPNGSSSTISSSPPPVPKVTSISDAVQQCMSKIIPAAKSVVKAPPTKSSLSIPVMNFSTDASPTSSSASPAPKKSRVGTIREIQRRRQDEANFVSFASQLLVNDIRRRNDEQRVSEQPSQSSSGPLLYVPKAFRCALARDPDDKLGKNEFIQFYVDADDVSALDKAGNITFIAFKDELFPVLPIGFPSIRMFRVDQLPANAKVILPEKVPPRRQDLQRTSSDVTMADPSSRRSERNIIFLEEGTRSPITNVASIQNASLSMDTTDENIVIFFFDMLKVLSPVSAKRATCSRFRIDVERFKRAFPSNTSSSTGAVFIHFYQMYLFLNIYSHHCGVVVCLYFASIELLFIDLILFLSMSLCCFLCIVIPF